MICCTKVRRRLRNPRSCARNPCVPSRNCRDECPCPRQSIIATAKPRSRRSRTVSKYFSMLFGTRRLKTQTVPLRPFAGRLPARKPQLSAVRRLDGAGHGPLGNGVGGNGDERHGGGPVRRKTRDFKGGRSGRRESFGPPCEPPAPSPYQLHAGLSRLHDTKARPLWRAGYCNSRSMEDYPMRSYDLTPFYRSTGRFRPPV
jgi:hypothetical protein